MSEPTIAETRSKVETLKKEFRDEIAKFPENWRQMPISNFRRDMKQKFNKLITLQNQVQQLATDLQRRKSFEAAVRALDSQMKCAKDIDSLNDSFTLNSGQVNAENE